MFRLQAVGKASLNSDRNRGPVIPVSKLYRVEFPFVYFVYFVVSIELLQLRSAGLLDFIFHTLLGISLAPWL